MPGSGDNARLMTTPDPDTTPRFRDLALSEPLLRALDDVGYESPSPIQAQTIPPLIEGRDLLGQAQTGTGKTAAFALPALSRTDLFHAVPQTLVLAPTRELAIQVAEAFQKYATHLPGFRVLPIYGGQSYEPQLKGLRRGVHVVVGTPGRVVDHIKRGTLRLDALRMLVLDEADEMLRMGFIDDVEWVLQQTPPTRQIALFSATMPSQIRRVAQAHLKDPVEIHVKAKTTTATNIRQRWWMVAGANKLEGLTRILEAETFDGMIIFARTKIATTELAEKLEARGFNAAPLNGDLDQKSRERTIGRLRDGSLDILVATDVAARGLDVERISHVLNYDIPTDTESYVHRIGRTGRAGRSGDAILFVAPREQHLLRAIERATRQRIDPMSLPTEEALQDRRVQRFRQAILDLLAEPAAKADLDRLQQAIEAMQSEQGIDASRIAAALAYAAQTGGRIPPAPSEASKSSRASAKTPAAAPAPVNTVPPPPPSPRPAAAAAPPPRPAPAAPPPIVPSPHPVKERPGARPERPERPDRKARKDDDEEMETFRVEVGAQHGLKAGNLMGAIANEAGLDGAYVGKIDIRDDHTLIDLPAGMPRGIFRDLQKVWVAGRQLRISRMTEGAVTRAGPSRNDRKDRDDKTRRRP
ncbi:MAG: ATP-dependent helicase [Panacagrimonas sp.]|jgi:ATP-dependent RNA helicase DeaD|nr:ATP-dependent helicase [Panacagrimonas sp.]